MIPHNSQSMIVECIAARGLSGAHKFFQPAHPSHRTVGFPSLYALIVGVRVFTSILPSLVTLRRTGEPFSDSLIPLENIVLSTRLLAAPTMELNGSSSTSTSPFDEETDGPGADDPSLCAASRLRSAQPDDKISESHLNRKNVLRVNSNNNRLRVSERIC
jgi:hypothetical protein